MKTHFEDVEELDFTTVSKVFPSPLDWRDAFIYFLLVDRFDDGNQNPPPCDPDAVSTGRDPAAGGVFQGGNLRGVMRRLDYIKGLGANAVWLSPVFKNRVEQNDSYHGYGIQDFLDVDPRFGTREDLKNLVKKAHDLGMYVILDIVLNHTGDNWAYPGDVPYYFWRDAPGPFPFGFWRKVSSGAGLEQNDAVWPRELQDPNCYKRRGQIRNWSDPVEALNGDFFSLKELDLTRPFVLDTLIKVYKYWIAFADVDGFRLDTVKHMEDSATAIFCNAVREYAKSIGKHNFFIFGEVVGDDVVLERYIGRNSRIPGTDERFPSLDACLDFPLYFILEEVIKGFANPSVLRERYERFRTLYADHGEAGQYFVGFVDNHDQMCRPYRRFMCQNPFPEQAVLAIGYLLTSTGIPCIYYGTEQGFDGGGDRDYYVRECMFGGMWGAFNTTGCHFFKQDHPIYRDISKVASIRMGEPALRYGRQYFRKISGNGVDFGYPLDGRCTLAYSRILDTTEILITMNLDNEPRSDYVIVDRNLTRAGTVAEDLLSSGREVMVEDIQGVHAVRVPLGPHEMGIFKVGSP